MVFNFQFEKKSYDYPFYYLKKHYDFYHKKYQAIWYGYCKLFRGDIHGVVINDPFMPAVMTKCLCHPERSEGSDLQHFQLCRHNLSP